MLRLHSELLELAIEEFTGNPNLTTYRKLQKITLVKCITFIRRRGNDVAALNVAEFEKACATDVSGSNKVISETLSKKAKKNMKHANKQTTNKHAVPSIAWDQFCPDQLLPLSSTS